MRRSRNFIGRFAVRGVFWREYLDWAVINLPFYFYPVLMFFWTFFFFFFAAPARRAIVGNLRIVLPGSSPAMNYLRAFRTLYQFAWTITEAAIHKANEVEFAYEIVGTEWLNELAAAKGAIVITAHMGSYDLGAALFAQKFNREIQIVRAPEPDQQAAQHLAASLERSGQGAVKVAYNSEGALLSFDLLNALRGGLIVSIQGDRVEGDIAAGRGRLFGAEVPVPNGPFVLGLAARVPIYPLFIVRSGYRSYQIIAHKPIIMARTDRPREDVLAQGLSQWCEVLEKTIARHWDQWFAFTPIFSVDETR